MFRIFRTPENWLLVTTPFLLPENTAGEPGAQIRVVRVLLFITLHQKQLDKCGKKYKRPFSVSFIIRIVQIADENLIAESFHTFQPDENFSERLQ